LVIQYLLTVLKAPGSILTHTRTHTQVCASTHRGKTDDPILKWANWMLWLTPVILATQEEEIRRISVQSQP
jgi:hypothetical protein